MNVPLHEIHLMCLSVVAHIALFLKQVFSHKCLLGKHTIQMLPAVFIPKCFMLCAEIDISIEKCCWGNVHVKNVDLDQTDPGPFCTRIEFVFSCIKTF